MTRLEEICTVASANSDDAIDDLLNLLKPETMTREEMQQNFEDTIGYDPISYHDKKELGASIEALRDTDALSPDQEEYLRDNHKEVVNMAYDCYTDKYRSSALNDALTETLAEHGDVNYAVTEAVTEEEQIDYDSKVQFHYDE